MNKRTQRLMALLLFLIPMIIYSCKNDDDEEEDENYGGLYWIECSGNITDTTKYYVSTSGNDENNGLTVNSTFRSLRKAFSTVKPGGSILIFPGTYYESIGLLSCGNDALPITVEGFQGTPVIDGQSQFAMGIWCESCNNFIFRNIKIQNFTDIGIGAEKSKNFLLNKLEILENGHAVQLRDWEFEGYGIHIELSENIEITDNTVYRNGPDPQIIPAYLMGTGINTFGNKNVVISGNKSFRNIGGGILVEDSYDVIVENNDVYENDLDASIDEWWDGGLWVDGGGNVIVRNNYFHDNLGPGIEISDEDFQNPKGYILENNQCNNNYYGIFIWNFGTSTWPDSTIIKNINNDFTNNSIQDVWIVPWIYGQ